MKRIFMALGLAIGLAVPVVAGSIAFAGPASAIACTDWTTGYKFQNKTATYVPTSAAYDWVWPRYAPFHESYSITRSYTNSVSVTTTVSTQEGAIFASFSASIGVTVGHSWGQSQTWTVTSDFPKDPTHDYRMHLYHRAWTFQVMKVSTRYCNTGVQSTNLWSSWQTVSHAPVKSASANLWEQDKRVHQ